MTALQAAAFLLRQRPGKDWRRGRESNPRAPEGPGLADRYGEPSAVSSPGGRWESRTPKAARAACPVSSGVGLPHARTFRIRWNPPAVRGRRWRVLALSEAGRVEVGAAGFEPARPRGPGGLQPLELFVPDLLSAPDWWNHRESHPDFLIAGEADSCYPMAPFNAGAASRNRTVPVRSSGGSATVTPRLRLLGAVPAARIPGGLPSRSSPRLSAFASACGRRFGVTAYALASASPRRAEAGCPGRIRTSLSTSRASRPTG